MVPSKLPKNGEYSLGGAKRTGCDGYSETILQMSKWPDQLFGCFWPEVLPMDWPQLVHALS